MHYALKTALTGAAFFTMSCIALEQTADSLILEAGEVKPVFQNTRLSTLTIAPGAQIIRPGKAVTMLVNGVETAMKPGTYKNVELIITSRFHQSPAGETDRGVDDFRTALLINGDGMDTGRSVTQAISAGSYDAKSATGLVIESDSGNFNGIMADGDIEYHVSNAVFKFNSNSNGLDSSDFSGYGAALAAYNGAKLTVTDSEIEVGGVARLAFYAFGGADILIEDSEFSVHGGNLYEAYPNSADFSAMVAPPWVLGITGSARGTNMMGNKTTFTMVRTRAEAANWGVLSTDLGAAMLLTVVDSSLTLTGEKTPLSPQYGSGYGTYILGSEHFYYGVTINAGTYAGIIRDGDAYYGASNFKEPLAIYPREQIPTGKTVKDFFGNDKPVFDVKPSETAVFTDIKGQGKTSTISSDFAGWMSHGDGKLVLDGRTRVKTGNAVFLLKDGNVDITVKGDSTLEPANGVLLQMIDNDDMLVGLQQDSQVAIHFNTVFNEPAGYPGIDYETAAPSTDKRQQVFLTLEDTKLTGDIFNATGYAGGQPGDQLNITLSKNASLTGTVSATSAIHVDEHGSQKTHIPMEEYYYLGNVANRQHYNGVNDIKVSLKSGSVWKVTSPALVSELQIEKGASILSAGGSPASISVNGKPVSPEAGHYTGVITIR